MKTRGVLTVAIAFVATACGTLPTPADVPAVIVEATAAGRAEVARVVGEATNGAPVLLADDALTRDSVLVIERREPPGPEGRVLTGRTLEAPLRLRLVLNDATCMLVRDGDGRRWPLTEVRCQPRQDTP